MTAAANGDFAGRVPEIAEAIGEECRKAAQSAAGLDGLEPGEMALFSDPAFQHIASLLNIIEQGAAWPKGMDKGKAVFMPKDDDKPDDHIQYRDLDNDCIADNNHCHQHHHGKQHDRVNGIIDHRNCK